MKPTFYTLTDDNEIHGGMCNGNTHNLHSSSGVRTNAGRCEVDDRGRKLSVLYVGVQSHILLEEVLLLIRWPFSFILL